MPRDKVVTSYLKITGTKVTAFVSYFENSIKGGFMTTNGNTSKIAELLVILSNDYYHDLKQLLKILSEQQINYFVTTNLGKNMIFIDRLNFIPAKRCYFQMYNYGTKRTFQPSEILINLP